jgi:nanoRNase/pAp phosphatase (c-di-AMP/oligoRNAs hydrolase)
MTADSQSAARVVYDSFGGATMFPRGSVETMEAVDRADAAQLSIEDILDSPDVAERVALYREHADAAVEQIRRCSISRDRVVVLDLRDEEIIHPTNRFLVYVLHPECTVSIHVLWGLKQNTVFAVERSILVRSSKVDIGALMLAHGGGGHQAAGTCQIDNDRAEAVLDELVQTIIDRERELVAG